MTAINLENQSRKSLNEALQNLDFHRGIGFFYSPSLTNNQINSGFQILEFDGQGFKHQGVFKGDSLQIVLSQNP